ncbi:ADP-dependent NAD(P)H-hydrate dehydratase [Planomicrobium soli]|uniref:ADP-dependent (S)-NAD(P)H-hydrate dehydratase n=1 Tax=Planomicrobium soli TaxID=1176648 RepID=A0A2P8H6D8_9BACL|nr:NAD(P)H-hydrate dehydratase [Planomicrobium soli]PSL41760.1 ADP-dependent NAD(P)H-hydrate dehydratase [Planomicrobium soli]
MANLEEHAGIWNKENVRSTLPLREVDSHKGTYGTGLLIAGSPDMPGATMLAGLGAMRSGAGKLVIGTEPEVISIIVQRLPEATYESKALERIAKGFLELDSFRAIAIGPGIIPNDLTEKAIQKILAGKVPVILDAGALSKRDYEGRQAPTILTPHPLEFSRVTGIKVKELQQNRMHYARLCSKKLGAAIVLKGKETVVAFPDGDTWINPTGNSALAKGGTGDTLTGMLLGMLCIHEDWKHAVLNSVYLHGACADAWVEKNSAHTLLAHELTELLPQVWKEFE